MWPQMLYLLWLSHKSLRLCSLFQFTFYYSDWIIFIDPSSSLLVLSSVLSILILSLYSTFKFWLLHFSILKFSFDSLYSLLLCCSFVSICFKTIWNSSLEQFCKNWFKILANDSNIYIISKLASIDSLFSLELRLSWFFTWQVILSWMLDILSITLWHSDSYLKILFWPVVNLFRFRMWSQAHFCGLWLKCQFSLQSLSSALLVFPICLLPRWQKPTPLYLQHVLGWGEALPHCSGARMETGFCP